jgi:hypothetical protein
MRSPEKLRQDILQYVPKGEVRPIPAGLKGKMVGELNRIWGGDANRKIITGWIFTGDFVTPLSSSRLTNIQIAALLDWLQPAHEKNGWIISPTFRAEAALVYAFVAQEHVKTTSFKASGTGEKMKLPAELLKVLL